jgi:MoaA/NifB/PqqE/SkfB family radical SAM enzyme
MFRFSLSFGEFLLRRNLKHMILHVTNHCNFRCNHCFIDFSPKRDMKLDQYRDLASRVGRFFWLDIGGGEPFLRKDLAEIVTAFDVQVVQIPSNGSLPDQMIDQIERMRSLSRAEISVSLSLDGLKETHERMRGQPGNWEQVWSTFERLRKIPNLPVKINTVLQAETAHEILELMREVRHRSPDFHSIILLRGDPANPEMKLPSMSDLRDLGPQIFEILETYNYAQNTAAAHILRNYHKYLWNVSLRTLEERTQVVPCLAGQSHMVVMGDGRVSSCEMLEPVGDLRVQTWQEIMASDAFKRQVDDIKDKKCHCTHNCAMLDSILYNPRSLPHLLHQQVAKPNAG